MSEIDTLIGGVIGVVGAVIAAVVVHILDERRETKRLRRETALSLLRDKQMALRDAYYALVDLVSLLLKANANQPTEPAKLQEARDRFDTSVVRAVIWMLPSQNQGRTIVDAEKMLGRACERIISGERLTDKEFGESVANSFARIGVAIGKELGIDVLENQLREIALGSPSTL